MTWYTDQDELDYSKPIIAIGEKHSYLLVPSNLDTHAYAWLNIQTGEYDLGLEWISAKDAIDKYPNYEIKNAEIKTV